MPPTTGQTPDYLVSLHDVKKTFRDFWGRPKVQAVRGVTFGVSRGRIFGLLGPNGAGKSTVMKMMLGHLYPSSGQLRVFGLPATDVAAKKRLGYLPERAYLYKNLTPEETLHFFGEVLELPKEQIRSRTEQLLSMVGLDRSRKRLVGEFSHGMTRRMGLAQALLNDPDLLLLDEPTAGLDPLGCREVKNLIMTLARRGKTVVLTSHLLADVEDVCDEILVMYGGTVLAHGDTRSLLADQDVLQVRCPALAESAVRELQEVLYRHAPPAQVEFSSPSRSLENYFVQIVREASEKQETAGAQLGGGVASYLRDGVAENEAALDGLAHARKGAAPPDRPPQPAVVAAAAPVPLAPASPPLAAGPDSEPRPPASIPEPSPRAPMPEPPHPAREPEPARTPPPEPQPPARPPEPSRPGPGVTPPEVQPPAPDTRPPLQPGPAPSAPPGIQPHATAAAPHDAIGDMIRSARKPSADSDAAPEAGPVAADTDADVDDAYLNSLL